MNYACALLHLVLVHSAVGAEVVIGAGVPITSFWHNFAYLPVYLFDIDMRRDSDESVKARYGSEFIIPLKNRHENLSKVVKVRIFNSSDACVKHVKKTKEVGTRCRISLYP